MRFRSGGHAAAIAHFRNRPCLAMPTDAYAFRRASLTWASHPAAVWVSLFIVAVAAPRAQLADLSLTPPYIRPSRRNSIPRSACIISYLAEKRKGVAKNCATRGVCPQED